MNLDSKLIGFARRLDGYKKDKAWVALTVSTPAALDQDFEYGIEVGKG
jgi:hypothetical protein